MKSILLRTTAAALAATIIASPGIAIAGKGGVPAAQAQENGRGADNAHRNGRSEDPNPTRGNDSRPDPGPSTGGDTSGLEKDYEEVGAESADVEGEEDVEE